MKILVTDTTAGFLSRAWETGTFLGGFDLVIRADSWEEVYTVLTNLELPAGVFIEQIQVWGHGQQGKPLINGFVVSVNKLRRALLDKINHETIIWWRACDVAEGKAGHEFMELCVNMLECDVAAHCEVISWPNPLWQKQVCGLHPGQKAWWSLSGNELPGCSTLRMNPSRSWWRDQ